MEFPRLTRARRLSSLVVALGISPPRVRSARLQRARGAFSRRPALEGAARPAACSASPEAAGGARSLCARRSRGCEEAVSRAAIWGPRALAYLARQALTLPAGLQCREGARRGTQPGLRRACDTRRGDVPGVGASARGAVPVQPARGAAQAALSPSGAPGRVHDSWTWARGCRRPGRVDASLSRGNDRGSPGPLRALPPSPPPQGHGAAGGLGWSRRRLLQLPVLRELGVLHVPRAGEGARAGAKAQQEAVHRAQTLRAQVSEGRDPRVEGERAGLGLSRRVASGQEGGCPSGCFGDARGALFTLANVSSCGLCLLLSEAGATALTGRGSPPPPWISTRAPVLSAQACPSSRGCVDSECGSWTDRAPCSLTGSVGGGG